MKQLLGLIESAKKERSRSSLGSSSFRSGVEGLTSEIAAAAEPATTLEVVQGRVPNAEPASPHADSLMLLDNIAQPRDLLQLSEHTRTYPLPKLDVVTTIGGEEEQNTYVIASQTADQEPNASTTTQKCKTQTSMFAFINV